METRRNFIKNTLRTAAFSILAGGSAYLLFREQSEEVCDFDFVCKNCKKLKECKLPEAKDVKTKNFNNG